MTPAELGNVLLVPGHPEVTEAIIGPTVMEPPPPPNSTVDTRLKLYLKAKPSDYKGFCERIVATTYMKPAVLSESGISPASRPDTLSTELTYRWVGTEPPSACDAPRAFYFSPPSEHVASALTAIRLLATAQRLARAGRRLPYVLSIEDREGPIMLAFERAHPGIPRLPDLKVITDAREALAMLPIDVITWVNSSNTYYFNVLTPADLSEHGKHRPEGIAMFMGSDWTIGVVLDGQRITHIRMLRAFPPPF